MIQLDLLPSKSWSILLRDGLPTGLEVKIASCCGVVKTVWSIYWREPYQPSLVHCYSVGRNQCIDVFDVCFLLFVGKFYVMTKGHIRVSHQQCNVILPCVCCLTAISLFFQTKGAQDATEADRFFVPLVWHRGQVEVVVVMLDVTFLLGRWHLSI